jgi:propanol-preferring alcohol dehydrogenase
MQAIRFNDWKTFPALEDIPRPIPGPGEVLLKVAGAGACHSDIGIYHDFERGQVANMEPPFTLGHETSGWVEELGPGVSGFAQGDAFLVYGPIGCGRCAACSRGQDTYCENVATMPYLASGIGRDGGMAEYVAVPARNLVPLGDSDAIDAAPLSDAGLTPYHAIKLALPKLAGGGRTALVIGLGGLGQTAVQILTALSGAKVIATDMKESAMRRAAADGAVTVGGGPDQLAQIRDLTDGRGVDAVFDMVGAGPTIALAMGAVARRGRATIVGIAGGSYSWSFFGNPYEAELTNTYWGTIEELHEVAAMYRLGQIRPLVERYTLANGLEAYRRLQAGEIEGRAVVVPHGG